MDTTPAITLDSETYGKVYYNSKFVQHPDFEDVFVRWSDAEQKPHCKRVRDD